MARLLDIYEEMEKQAQEQEEVPVQTQEQVEDTSGLSPETLEVLDRYSEAANSYLLQEFGEGQFNDDDVIKVAELMIADDADRLETMEKVAELQEAGIVMARSFTSELQKLGFTFPTA